MENKIICPNCNKEISEGELRLREIAYICPLCYNEFFQTFDGKFATSREFHQKAKEFI
jgi:Zn finger protein HypA/HybF involved in hydrogenase expression